MNQNSGEKIERKKTRFYERTKLNKCRFILKGERKKTYSHVQRNRCRNEVHITTKTTGPIEWALKLSCSKMSYWGVRLAITYCLYLYRIGTMGCYQKKRRECSFEIIKLNH